MRDSNFSKSFMSIRLLFNKRWKIDLIIKYFFSESAYARNANYDMLDLLISKDAVVVKVTDMNNNLTSYESKPIELELNKLTKIFKMADELEYITLKFDKENLNVENDELRSKVRDIIVNHDYIVCKPSWRELNNFKELLIATSNSFRSED